MKLLSSLLALALCGIGNELASASPNPLSGRSSYSLQRRETVPHPIVNGELHFVGPVTPGGPNITLSGTAQSIMHQIKTLNPAFDPNDFEVSRNALAAHKERMARGSDAKELEARDKTGVKNCYAFGTAYANDIRGAIDSLRANPGTCWVDGGPGRCVHLTCTMDGGVPQVTSLCNDNTGPIWVQCSYLASYVSDIVTDCYGEGEPTIFAYFTGGQEFDTANWNVIVGTDIGNCG